MKQIRSSTGTIKVATGYTYFGIYNKKGKFLGGFHIVDSGQKQKAIEVYFAGSIKTFQADDEIRVVLN